jgi:Tfp pilus assembly protein PilF
VISTLFLLSLFSCVTAENARKSDTRTDLGTAYLKEGNTPGAVEALRQASALNPQNATAWERLGLAYMASDAPAQAEDAFQRAIRVGTALEPARVHYNYGLLLVKLERHEEALAQFDITLSDLTYRTPAKALNSKGYTLYMIGRYDEAITVLGKAISRSPKLCQARFHRALSYQAKDEHSKALDDFESVIQSCGAEATGAYYHAALSLFPLGETDAGCNYLRTARRASSSDDFTKKIMQTLQSECGA